VKRALLVAVALLAAGCGGGDPERDRLKTGDVVELYGDPAKLAKEDGRLRTHTLVDPADWIAYGTRMRVLGDIDPEDTSLRDVSVIVTEGELKDRTVRFSRYMLRRVN